MKMFSRRPKGQSAMEYLMTYGWAILVVIAVIVALYGLGVFRVGTGGVSCSPCFTYFAYVDYAAGTLAIRNGAQQISVTGITAGGTPITVISGDCGTGLPATCQPGSDVQFAGILETGDQTVVVTYTVISSGLSHSDNGVIHQ